MGLCSSISNNESIQRPGGGEVGVGKATRKEGRVVPTAARLICGIVKAMLKPIARSTAPLTKGAMGQPRSSVLLMMCSCSNTPNYAWSFRSPNPWGRVAQYNQRRIQNATTPNPHPKLPWPVCDGPRWLTTYKDATLEPTPISNSTKHSRWHLKASNARRTACFRSFLPLLPLVHGVPHRHGHPS